METEIEIKLLVAAEQQELLAAAFEARSDVRSHRRMVLANTYYDTPQQQLRQWQMGLRVRSRDGQHEQTIKTAGREVGGLHQRPEYNLPLAQPEPQLNAFPADIWPDDSDLAELQQQLQPLFTTHFQRRVWVIEYADGSAVEVALDAGEISAGGRSEAISEIEFELLSGSADYLFELAAEICALCPCQIGGDSKAARGYRLAADKPPQVRELPAMVHDDEQSVEAAFEQAFAVAMQQIQHHQSCLRNGGELDAVRQLRFGYQLLIQALRVFAPAISQDAAQAWHKPLTPLVEGLEWVVDATFLANLLADRGHLLRKLDDQELLIDALDARRAALPGVEAVRQRLASGRDAAVNLELSRWLFEQAWRRYLVNRNGTLVQPLVAVAGDWLGRDWQPLLSALDGDEPLAVETYLAQWPALVQALWSLYLLGGSGDEQALEEFRSAWHDVQRGIFELAQLRYLHDVADTVPLTDADHFHRWFERKQESLCHALEQSRLAALRLDLPWQD